MQPPDLISEVVVEVIVAADAVGVGVVEKEVLHLVADVVAVVDALILMKEMIAVFVVAQEIMTIMTEEVLLVEVDTVMDPMIMVMVGPAVGVIMVLLPHHLPAVVMVTILPPPPVIRKPGLPQDMILIPNQTVMVKGHTLVQTVVALALTVEVEVDTVQKQSLPVTIMVHQLAPEVEVEAAVVAEEAMIQPKDVVLTITTLKLTEQLHQPVQDTQGRVVTQQERVRMELADMGLELTELGKPDQ